MTSPQSKQSKVDEVDAQRLIEQIDEVQTQLDRLNEMASEEILQVEMKYNKQRQPHHQRRSVLISRLPQFWLTVFVNHPQLSSIIDNDDADVLQYLRSVEIEDSEDVRSGYSIKLIFDNNPYFENTELIKEFNISEACEATSKTTPIAWKPGKNFVDQDKTNNSVGGLNRKRTHSANAGFFNWFKDNTDAGADEIGEIIKDDIYINPLQYYLVDAPANVAQDDEGYLMSDENNNVQLMSTTTGCGEAASMGASDVSSAISGSTTRMSGSTRTGGHAESEDGAMTAGLFDQNNLEDEEDEEDELEDLDEEEEDEGEEDEVDEEEEGDEVDDDHDGEEEEDVGVEGEEDEEEAVEGEDEFLIDSNDNQKRGHEDINDQDNSTGDCRGTNPTV